MVVTVKVVTVAVVLKPVRAPTVVALLLLQLKFQLLMLKLLEPMLRRLKSLKPPPVIVEVPCQQKQPPQPQQQPSWAKGLVWAFGAAPASTAAPGAAWGAACSFPALSDSDSGCG